MLKLATETIFFVDTHCQWYAEDDCELFVSALSYGGYDAGIMAVPRTTPILEDILRKCRSPFLPCHGSELMFSFAHIIAMGYEGELPEQGDPIEKLRFLRSKAALLLFVHPGGSELLTSGKVHDCFREKLLDGFEYFNGYDFLKDDSLSRELFQTFGYTPVAGVRHTQSQTAQTSFRRLHAGFSTERPDRAGQRYRHLRRRPHPCLCRFLHPFGPRRRHPPRENPRGSRRHPVR